MSKPMIRAIAVLVGLILILAIGGFAAAKMIREGNIVVRDNGGISPTRLPRHEQAPITALIAGEVETVDGSHPPALKTVAIDIDRTIQLDAKGLSACREGQLVGRSTSIAKKVCREAIVGSGEGEAEVAFPEQKPFDAHGPLVLFNGGVHGGSTLLLGHFYAPVPAPTAIVIPVKLTHIHRGHFGLRAVARIPAIAGGAGSATRFKFKVGRRFASKGRPESYLTASCPTGRYYTEGKATFTGGTTLNIAHAFNCTPTG